VPPVRYDLCFYIAEDGIVISHRPEKRQILHSINSVVSVAEM
jgi:hypothetical protein